MDPRSFFFFLTMKIFTPAHFSGKDLVNIDNSLACPRCYCSLIAVMAGSKRGPRAADAAGAFGRSVARPVRPSGVA